MNALPSAITPEVWYRLLEAFNAGAPPLLACQYAEVSYDAWLAGCRRTAEFKVVAQRVRASGAVACLMFVQQTAATDWRVASEFLKLAFPEFFGTKAREAPSDELVRDDDPETEVSPDDVAAVIRILRANGLGGFNDEGGGHTNGRQIDVTATNAVEKAE